MEKENIQKKQLLLSELITLLDHEFLFEVALYEEDENGDVYRTDCPVGYYECWKEYLLGMYHYKHIGDKKLKDQTDFGNLVVLGINKYAHCDDTDKEYDISVAVKVKKDQVEWEK